MMYPEVQKKAQEEIGEFKCDNLQGLLLMDCCLRRGGGRQNAGLGRSRESSVRALHDEGSLAMETTSSTWPPTCDDKGPPVQGNAHTQRRSSTHQLLVSFPASGCATNYR